WVAAGVMGLAMVAAVALGGAPVLSWLTDVPSGVPQSAPLPEPLPMVRAADVLLDKARALKAGGHPHEALRLLDQVDGADPARDDANQMRAEIQRDLLAGASANAAPVGLGAVR